MNVLTVVWRSMVASRAGRVALVALGLSLGSAAQAAPEAASMQLKTEAFREVEVTGKTGKKEKQLQAITRAVPGQEVVYVIAYRNAGAKPADSVVVNNPVPKGLVYLAGSAQGAGARADVSVDGGKRYGALETLTVTGADGKSRAARAEDVTHVRWTLAAALKPGGEGKVTYRAVLK